MLLCSFKCLVWLNSTNTLNDSLSSSDHAVSSGKDSPNNTVTKGLSRSSLDNAVCTQCQSTQKSAIIQASAAVFLRPSQGMLVVVYRRFGTIIKGQAKHAVFYLLRSATVQSVMFHTLNTSGQCTTQLTTPVPICSRGFCCPHI